MFFINAVFNNYHFIFLLSKHKLWKEYVYDFIYIGEGMRSEDIKNIMLNLPHIIRVANAMLMIYLKCEYYKFAR